jgi:hypothetical protein
MVMEENIAQWIHEKLLVGVVRDMKWGFTNPKRVRGLVEVN